MTSDWLKVGFKCGSVGLSYTKLPVIAEVALTELTKKKKNKKKVAVKIRWLDFIGDKIRVVVITILTF